MRLLEAFLGGYKVKQHHGLNRKQSNYPRYIFQGNKVAVRSYIPK